jgi:2-keto-3-deoxy-L-rhamnonate aldolase RhmA
MAKITNLAKERMQKGGIAIGLGVRVARTVDIGLLGATAGFYWLFIDNEHTSLDMSMTTEIATAALGQGITPIVRVPGKQHFHSTRVLDNGAQGIIVPHVENAAEAKAIADFSKFPPIGHRSISRASALIAFQDMPVREFVDAVNEATLVTVMIESPNAVDNAEEIAAVPGIDCLLIGTNDFCAEAGIHGQYDHEKTKEAYKRVIGACQKHGKFAGMAGIGSEAIMQMYVEMGAQFLLAGNDHGMIQAGGKARTTFLRGVNGK